MTLEDAAAELKVQARVRTQDAPLLDSLLAIVRQEAAAVERFKTDNAILQNSKAYFDMLGDRLAVGGRNLAMVTAVAALGNVVLHFEDDPGVATQRSVSRCARRGLETARRRHPFGSPRLVQAASGPCEHPRPAGAAGQQRPADAVRDLHLRRQTGDQAGSGCSSPLRGTPRRPVPHRPLRRGGVPGGPPRQGGARLARRGHAAPAAGGCRAPGRRRVRAPGGGAARRICEHHRRRSGATGVRLRRGPCLFHQARADRRPSLEPAGPALAGGVAAGPDRACACGDQRRRRPAGSDFGRPSAARRPARRADRCGTGGMVRHGSSPQRRASGRHPGVRSRRPRSAMAAGRRRHGAPGWRGVAERAAPASGGSRPART